MVNHDVSLIPVCRSEISGWGATEKMIGGKEAKRGPKGTAADGLASSGKGQTISGASKEWA